MKLSIVLGATLLALGSAALAAAAPVHAQGFGQSLAVGDGEVLIGESLSTREPGYVYVYRPDGDGNWVEVQRLEASDAAPNDHFGRALALEGGSLLVGATVAPGGISGQAPGAMYVFEKARNGTWRETQMVVPEGVTEGEAFGRAVVRRGGRAMVAAWGDEEGRGAVYLFRQGRNGQWTQEARLAAEDGQPNDFFGFAMDFDEDMAVVSALMNAQQARGAIYTFRREEAGAWRQVARMDDLENGPAGLQLGAQVHLDGDELLVSAPGANQFTGEVRRYRWSEDGWQPAGVIGAFDGANTGAGFGAALVRAGGELWIAAPGAGGGEGRIYRHVLGEDGIEAASKLYPDGLTSGDQFGGAAAVLGDLAAVTLAGADFGLARVAVLEREGDGWTQVASLFTEDETLPAIAGDQVDCEDGSVDIFPCRDVDIVSFLPVSDIGGRRGVELNDVWGWTDPETGREYALVGRVDGTSFVDISDPSHPRYLGDLPMTDGARANSWRDIKVYGNHAFVVADGAGQHGMQVFDLTRLRDVAGQPVTFDVDAHYDAFASAHNVVIDTASGTAFAVGVNSGGESCGGGLHMIDITEPTSPTFAGCFADPQTGNSGTGYTHDAQCVTYSGPDTEHRGREICLGANETMLSIADVTDKGAPVALARSSYPGVAYAHQGWLTEDQRYFYMNDEGDESQMQQRGEEPRTRTLIWDVSDLDDPVFIGEYFHDNSSIDHNLYIKGDLMYQSNYVSGLRILDISEPEAPELVGYIDTVPWGDDMPSFDGSWSNYPFFESGVIVVTSGAEGVFFVKKRERPVIP